MKTKRGTARIAPGRRKAVYVTAGGLWLTGALWLIFRYFVQVTDEFGFNTGHPLERWWLILHAGFAFAAIWFFGLFWDAHVKPGWAVKARRRTGGWLFGVTVWLIVTGFALYYVGSPGWRSWMSALHWTAGLLALALFLLHLPRRKRRATESLRCSKEAAEVRLTASSSTAVNRSESGTSP